jgi:hypothetical protein
VTITNSGRGFLSGNVDGATLPKWLRILESATTFGAFAARVAPEEPSESPFGRAATFTLQGELDSLERNKIHKHDVALSLNSDSKARIHVTLSERVPVVPVFFWTLVSGLVFGLVLYESRVVIATHGTWHWMIELTWWNPELQWRTFGFMLAVTALMAVGWRLGRPLPERGR